MSLLSRVCENPAVPGPTPSPNNSLLAYLSQPIELKKTTISSLANGDIVIRSRMKIIRRWNYSGYGVKRSIEGVRVSIMR
jgi:hypothetical protein